MILEFLATVFGALGGVAVVIYGLSGWLGKVWANRILEQQRADLQTLIDGHRIRLDSLQERRGKLIAELYEKLHRVDYGVRKVDYWVSQDLLSPDKDWIAKASIDLTEHLNDLREHFEIHQIYFSENLCKLLRVAIDSSYEISDTYFVKIIDADESDLKQRCQEASKAILANKETVDNTLHVIRDEFRKLLGVI
jgi:hypothetical protein